MKSSFLLESINQKTFIIADPQFGSRSLFEHIELRRHYGSIETLHDTLIENWNANVREDDFVLCLGGFSQNIKNNKKSKELIEEYTSYLNGKKILIRGNHDAENTCWYYDFGWNCLIEQPIIMIDGCMEWLTVPSQFCGCIITYINGRRIMFSHFAIFEDEYKDCRYLIEKAFLRELFEEYECEINIHGHSHHRTIDDPRCLCACVEQTDFSPVRLRDFLESRLVENTQLVA